MMKRAILTIKGDVQEVGYRSVVMKTAQKLGLAGYVENVPDGTVKIICEGEEKDIDEFVERIKIKNEMADVESVDKKFEEATGEFEGFVVNIPDIKYETFQGFGTARKYLVKGIEETKKVGEKVDHVGEKVDDMHQDMNTSFDKLDHTIGTRFDNLDNKYGEFGKDMKDIKTDISLMKEMGQDVRELSRQISRLVDYFIEKDKGKA